MLVCSRDDATFAFLEDDEMKEDRRTRWLSVAGFLVSFWLCGLCVPANAQINIINVNENCNGTLNGGLLPCSFSTDPGPGGLSGVMTYALNAPFPPVAGDVVLRETGSVNSDVIRFSSVGSGSFFFYSDLDGGVDAPADIGLPTTLNTNVLFLTRSASAPSALG
jgi:hypothetical protein